MRKSHRAIRRRVSAAATVAIAGTTLAIAPATPALSAPAQRCRAQSTSIHNLATGGDMQVSLEVCVASDGGSARNAFVRHIWWETYSPVNGYLFDAFNIWVRLERNQTDYSTHKCVLGYYVNRLDSPDSATPSTCSAGKITTSLRGGWTGDGYLEYNRAGSPGRQTWQFQGTPVIN
jgi:hypothetical protein